MAASGFSIETGFPCEQTSSVEWGTYFAADPYSESRNLPTGNVPNTQLPYAVQTQPTFIQQPVPLTVLISRLNLRFMKLRESCPKKQLEELQSFYVLKSAEMESERFASLSSPVSNQCMQGSTNNYFDIEHQALIDRIEHSLNMCEQLATKPTMQGVPASAKQTIRSNSTNSSVAIRIMTNWFERNGEHPYPSYETAEVMAKAGGISVEQVKKWFANKRRRHGITKHITEIAKRRKRSRTVSKDDILFSGCINND